MTKGSMSRRVFALLLLVSSGASFACRGGDLTPGRAAALLKSSSDFTTRAGSPVGRELVEVTFVRKVARRYTEVEFRWRNASPGTAGAADEVKTSMALFELTLEGWVLTSLFKVD